MDGILQSINIYVVRMISPKLSAMGALFDPMVLAFSLCERGLYSALKRDWFLKIRSIDERPHSFYF